MFSRPPSVQDGPWVGVGSGVAVGTTGVCEAAGSGVGDGGWVNGTTKLPSTPGSNDSTGSSVPPVMSEIESRAIISGRAIATWLTTSTANTATRPATDSTPRPAVPSPVRRARR